MIGKALLHYKIVEKIGAGGMGEVYRATDTRLGRDVAVKMMPEALANDPERRARFEREARAVAALNHPNIVTVHSVEEVDGALFLIMELVEGPTLSSVIPPAGLALDDLIEIALPLIDAVSRAHEKGIAHRDLKPGNVMLDARRNVKVLDFGLAKFVTSETPAGSDTVVGDPQTSEGLILGSVEYMSPEQAAGKQVDYRSDIFSLGVILFEMATGKRPFAGASSTETITAILRDDPISVTRLNPSMPGHFSRIINRCLAKERDRRFQTALDVRNELLELRETRAERAGVRWLAVLPFANLRDDKETDFLGYAVADQIIGTLAYFKNLSVRPSTSVRKYERQTVDAVTAGTDLQVDYVVTGNYMKQGDDVRLNVELVSIHDNKMVWRETVQASYADVFKLQDTVAQKVIDGLKVKFTDAEQTRGQANVPGDPTGYELYLRGISQPFSSEGNVLAIELLGKSTELDPAYAPAFAELGVRKRFRSQYILDASYEPRAGEAELRRALALNNQELKALANLSNMHMENGEADVALELARRAVEINPNRADSRFGLSYVYRYVGLLDEMVKELDAALALEPGNPRFRSSVQAYVYAGMLERALACTSLETMSGMAIAWRGQVCMRMGESDRALFELDRALRAEPTGVIGAWITGMRAAITGEREEGVAALNRVETSRHRDGELFYNIANIHALLGNVDGCVRMFQRAVDEGFFCYPFIKTDSFTDSVRAAPAFQEVLAQAKAMHDAFKSRFFPGR